MDSAEPNFEDFLQRSYRQAAYGMAGFSLLLVVVQLAMLLRFLQPLEGANRALFYFLPAITLLLGLVEFGYARGGWRFVREKGIALMVIGEGLLPTFGILIFGFSLGWEMAIGSPPLLGYLLMLMLGILRLSHRWILLTGLVEVSSFLLLLFWLWQSDQFPAGHAALHFGKALLILIGTAVAAVVAGRTRGFLHGMIEHHRRELQREREIYQKDRLISILAHDLRTPLNGISGLAEFMQRHPEVSSPGDLRRYAGEIHQSAIQLRALIDNLLEWARLRTGQLVPNFERLPLNEVIDPVSRMSEPALHSRGMELRIEGPVDAPVHTDLQLAQTILRNVLSNAIKFSPNTSRITIRVSNDHPVALEVIDCGPGLPSAVLEAFKTGETIALRPSGGLGLSLCRELAEHLGIEWHLGNADTGGAAVRLQFPGDLRAEGFQNRKK